MNEAAEKTIETKVTVPDQDARLLQQLGLLALLRRGLPVFYQGLMRESDEVLRIGAMAALLELRAIWSDQAEIVAASAHRGAVKRRAFPFFKSVFEYELAERVAATPTEDFDALLTARMRAELALDYKRMLELDLELFLSQGTPEYLWSAERAAERFGGWRAAVPVFAASLLVRPMDPNGPFQLLAMLRNANQATLVERICASFEASEVYKAEAGVFRAALLVDSGQHKEALKRLDRVPPNALNERLNTLNYQLRGEALNALGSFRDSYGAYQRMNAIEKATFDPRAFYKGIQQRSQYKIEATADDPRSASHLMMLGFPRSGTTLLENALAVHPRIETFEETEAFSRMARWIERFVPSTGQVPTTLLQTARDKYFDELDRQAQKSADSMRIDKMPLSSADAVFLNNVLPSVRYVFSIRHPHDVVLSCFRQSFGPNSAMENLRTIAGAAALYDFSMTQWFSVHSLEDDPSVVYVRYEDLVESFRPTLERTLEFIGVGWDDAVLGFVEAADRRFARTPSYKKVRSGLSIGVQSSRENYKFLFDTKETAMLKKWVKHFGYAD
ncbi:MAG TPA: sulfotransferase [Devosiaceae bacterium]|nr:sulfotransferase [Devosiaceae bacterium]